MKFLVTLIFSLLLSFCFSQEQTQTDTINQKVNGKKEGYWIKHNKKGETEWEGHFKNGKKNGLWRLYYTDGNYEEGKLINGKKIGEWYYVDSKTKTKLDMTKWDGKGNRVGGATLSW